MTALDLEDLALAEGGALVLKRALAGAEVVAVRGRSPTLEIDVAAWCRGAGHGFRRREDGALEVTRGAVGGARLRGAERAGSAAARGIVEAAPARWALAPRGALVEAGGPELAFPLDEKRVVWADEAPRLYAQASAAQWDPATAIPWREPVDLPSQIEDAVVQLMTYLVENETAALLVPARFLAQVHPHFREVQQLLAVQVADEARHIEVFTRRGLLCRDELGVTGAGGQASLRTLVEEPDFAVASFLLSVLGEGSFLSLLAFLRDHAPDRITREVGKLAGQDEARHVAFGLAHLRRHLGQEPALHARLAASVERRHRALADTAGLNEEVFDALVLLAAGDLAPAHVRRGHALVVELVREMDEFRKGSLERLGFSSGEAEALSALHTRNFM